MNSAVSAHSSAKQGKRSRFEAPWRCQASQFGQALTVASGGFTPISPQHLDSIVSTHRSIRGYGVIRRQVPEVRIRRVMRHVASASCGLLLSASSQAAELFKDCETVRSDSSFKALSLYFADHPDAPVDCVAVGNDAFVFTTGGNFFDCRRPSKHSTGLECRPDSPSSWYPDLEMLTSFAGAGKAFVLFHSVQLNGGLFGESYELFYLVPRDVDARGYRIVKLEGAGANDQSDGSGQCAVAADLPEGQAVEDIVRAGSPPYEILHAGRSGVTVRINQETVRCRTGEVVDSTISYRWSGLRFVRVMPR